MESCLASSQKVCAFGSKYDILLIRESNFYASPFRDRLVNAQFGSKTAIGNYFNLASRPGIFLLPREANKRAWFVEIITKRVRIDTRLGNSRSLGLLKNVG